MVYEHKIRWIIEIVIVYEYKRRWIFGSYTMYGYSFQCISDLDSVYKINRWRRVHLDTMYMRK